MYATVMLTFAVYGVLAIRTCISVTANTTHVEKYVTAAAQVITRSLGVLPVLTLPISVNLAIVMGMHLIAIMTAM